MNTDDELIAAGEFQSRLCRESSSLTYAAIIDELAAQLAGSTRSTAAELVAADGRDPVGTALYLRLLAAVHRLALDDPALPLRAYLPSTGGTVDLDAVVPAFLQTVDDHADTVAAGMQTDIQTNEVGRAAVLSAALNHIAHTSGPALRLLELGASAGLNLCVDRFRVDAGSQAWGPADSPVQLVDAFVGGDPPPGGYEVRERRGCDVNPVDLADPANRLMLRSFVWPEHVERLQRLERAIDIAVAGPTPVVDRAEASAWTAKQLTDLPADVTTVVFHSVVMPYLTVDQREELREVLRAAGEQADGSRRLARVSYEYRASHKTFCLSLMTWPGEHRQLLATGNPHGREVRWLATTDRPEPTDDDA